MPTSAPEALLGEADLWRTTAEAIRSRPRLSPLEFGTRYRVYSKEGRSARWRPEETPWAADILRALDEESPYRRIVCPKGTQLGFTELGLLKIGAGVIARQSVLMIEPTEAVAKRVVKQKFRPMIRSTTMLAQIFQGRAADTTLHFSADEADVIFAGSNSPSNFASITVPVAIGDEVDRWSPELANEGDPVDLLENRIAEYGFLGKLFLPSSPTVEGVSIVWREWLQSDQRYYECPCPKCGVLQAWFWEQIVWTPGAPETAALRCVACEEVSSEIEWKAIWGDGAWRATVADPVRKDTAGFHLSTLYARLGQRTWAQLVQTFEAAKESGLSSRLQTFWNTILGLPWKITEEAIPVERLKDRLEDHERGVAPAGSLLLTAGVDYQDNRLEVFVWAWARKEESWLVDKVLIERKRADGTDLPAREIAAALRREALDRAWPVEGGGELKVEMSVHDSGDRPADVFDVLQELNDPRRTLASKGTDGWGEKLHFRPPRVIDVKRDGKVVAHGRRLVTINTAVAKRAWYDDLRKGRQDEGPSDRFVHLPSWLLDEENLLEQFVAEEIRKTSRGRLAWVKIRDGIRNEALDCRIMAQCARWQLKSHRWGDAEWERREAALGVASAPNNPAPARRSRVIGRM